MSHFFDDEPIAVTIAREILDMHREVKRLQNIEADYIELRGKYSKSLNDSIKHGDKMIAGMFALAIKDSDPELAENMANNIFKADEKEV
jgi:hypothetical protein